VDREMILGMVSNKPKEAFERYRYFTEKEMGEAVESPLKKVYAGMILGEERFVKKALKRVKETWEGKHEISHRKRLQSVSGAEEILELVCRENKVTREVVGKRGEERDLAIYLLKRYTESTNGQIGEMFGLSFSAVTKAAERISSRLEMEKDLRRKVGKITDCFKG